MITYGNLALNVQSDPKHEMMIEYLSAENGYWLENDEWMADSSAYISTGLRTVRSQEQSIVDFKSYKNEALKTEMKYFILYGLKNKWRSPCVLQNNQKAAVRMIGERLGSNPAVSSFSEFYEMDESDIPDESIGETLLKQYKMLRNGIIAFIADIYDEREETEKDVWKASKIPGAKLSATMKRKKTSMHFEDIPDAYRPMVKRFMKRLIVRRSWAYCEDMLMYIRYFFNIFYEHGYTDGFLEALDRQDFENYLCWVAEDYAGKNATHRNKAVAVIRIWLDYIQIAEYPQAPVKSIEHLIFDEDIPKRDRIADTLERVKYIPAPVIQQMDANIEQIEPAEMRPLYVLLRETGWRATDVLNLRYDNCLQYIWNANENRSVPYLCGEITKVGIPELRDPIRDEVAEMVKLLVADTREKSTEENNPDRYLFNCYEGKCMGLPYSRPAFSKSVQKMINKVGIRDADGELFHFRAHGLRHTRAMEYAEQGMPIGVIKRLLGHCSLQMTLHYAQVTEDTLFQKWKATEKLDLFRPGTACPGTVNGNDSCIHYDRVRQNLDAVRVPFGVCFKPSKAGCRRQTEQCMECPSFCSTKDNLDEYDREIEKVTSMIHMANTLGRKDWIEKNQEYLKKLEKLKAEVEDKGIVHKSGSIREA